MRRAADARAAKRSHIENQIEDAADRTTEVEEFIGLLERVLEHTLSVDDQIDFASLRHSEAYPPFTPPAELTRPELEPQKSTYIDAVPIPGRFARMFSWIVRKYEADLQDAERRFDTHIALFHQREMARKAALDEAKAMHESQRFEAVWAATQRNSEVAELELAYLQGKQHAIVAYVTMVLERSDYLEEFPQEFRVAYVPDSREIIVDYELPSVNIVPTVVEYRYVKTRDVIEEKARKKQEIASIYQDIVASVALRTIHEVFESDQGKHVDVVTFSGFVDGIDPATGRDIRPYLISVRTTRDDFEHIHLRRVDKRVCLRNLGAQVSRQPDELLAVRPLVEFNMVDSRFVEQSDILSTLDSRPNIMDLTPFEFENFVGNLFTKLGLETRQTQASRDGGVDVVAFDLRPIVGGKVVIQAKRYRNTVGVAAVRDLYGTMMNEGANKGILVSTSGYGSDAFKFAKNKPIELIDGGGLLYLCEQVEIRAKIIFPEETK